MRRLIALCGAPSSGKTTVQKYLSERYGVIPVDDGLPMREIAMRYYGLTGDDVNTQEGKQRIVELPGGRKLRVRALLGELGNQIEAIAGPVAVAEMALKRIQSGLKRGKAYSFGSVRRQQGLVYKRNGGLVVEIDRPGFSITNEFDRYDQRLVDVRLHNGGDEEDLCHQVDLALKPYLTGRS